MSPGYRMIFPVCHAAVMHAVEPSVCRLTVCRVYVFWFWVEIWDLQCSLLLLDLCVMALFCCLIHFNSFCVW